MKRFLTALTAFSAVIFSLSSCQEKTDPVQDLDGPSITWTSNPDFATVNITADLDANLTVTAPAGIASFTVEVQSDVLEGALAAMGIETASLDLINDNTVIEALNMISGDSLTLGTDLLDRTEVNFDITSLVLLINTVTDVESDHAFVVNVTDANGNTATATCTFHRVNPIVGTYTLAPYTVDASSNYPSSSPIYVKWDVTGQEELASSFTGLFRLIGGIIFPQLIENVEFKADGNIVASYAAEPVVNGMDEIQSIAMGIMMGFGSYPSSEEVASMSTPSSEFTDSPEGMIAWTSQDGQITLKLDIANVIASALGNTGDAALIEQILTMEPDEVKQMLSMFLGETILNISNETISQIQGWAMNGIPMNVENTDSGVILYLPKTAFDPLMTVRPVNGENTSDVQILFKALQGILGESSEIQLVGTALQMISGLWSSTTDFGLGFSLVRAQ